MPDVPYHIPVMLIPAVDALDVQADGTYLDLTFGGGGHSREILRRLGPEGCLFAFDQDADAAANVPEEDARITFVHSNFRHLGRWMRYFGIDQVDGILADLGVSSHHFDDASRGFSFRADAPLDMRMNQAARRTAAQVIADCTEEELADILYIYGEMRQARRLAADIVRARAVQPVQTVGQLLEIARRHVDPRKEKKELACLFQALRIEVNQELHALREMLRAATAILRPEGRLVLLTYHSLEDRIAKNVLRAGNPEGRAEKDFFGRTLAPLRPLSAKPLLPTPEEVECNPRARSAKLRVGIKNADA